MQFMRYIFPMKKVEKNIETSRLGVVGIKGLLAVGFNFQDVNDFNSFWKKNYRLLSTLSQLVGTLGMMTSGYTGGSSAAAASRTLSGAINSDREIASIAFGKFMGQRRGMLLKAGLALSSNLIYFWGVAFANNKSQPPTTYEVAAASLALIGWGAQFAGYILQEIDHKTEGRLSGIQEIDQGEHKDPHLKFRELPKGAFGIALKPAQVLRNRFEQIGGAFLFARGAMAMFDAFERMQQPGQEKSANWMLVSAVGFMGAASVLIIAGNHRKRAQLKTLKAGPLAAVTHTRAR